MPRVLADIAMERANQDERWGEQNHPDGSGGLFAGVMMEEWANFAREVCNTAATVNQLTWAHILLEEFYEAMAESDPVRLREELVQVAAVATAWVEAIDRRAS